MDLLVRCPVCHANVKIIGAQDWANHPYWLTPTHSILDSPWTCLGVNLYGNVLGYKKTEAI